MKDSGWRHFIVRRWWLGKYCSRINSHQCALTEHIFSHRYFLKHHRLLKITHVIWMGPMVFSESRVPQKSMMKQFIIICFSIFSCPLAIYWWVSKLFSNRWEIVRRWFKQMRDGTSLVIDPGTSHFSSLHPHYWWFNPHDPILKTGRTISSCVVTSMTWSRCHQVSLMNIGAPLNRNTLESIWGTDTIFQDCPHTWYLFW